jgi:siroheme synthase-like protein
VSWPEAYPVFLDVRGSSVLVVGAGSVGTRKAEGLLRCAARVTVVAPQASGRLEELASRHALEWERREFAEGDVEGRSLVFAATPAREVNARVAAACRRRGIWVNVADTPDLCSFILPAVLDRAPLRVAVSTAGACPAYAQELRRRLEEWIPERMSGYVELLGRMRERARERSPGRLGAVSRAMVGSQAEGLWREGDTEAARAILMSIVEEG